MICTRCQQDFPPDGFYTSNKTRCKACVCAAVRAHREKNLDQVRAYDRGRNDLPHRVEARAAYRLTPAYAASHAAATKRWDAKYPERKLAQGRVAKAILRGKLIPWPVCEIPTCNEVPEAHHPHYGAPLLVTWLCPAHHAEAHKQTEALK